METCTIELPQPSGRVIVFSGVRLIGRQRERKVRHAGHWTVRIAPGLYAWYRSPWGSGGSPGGGTFYTEIDDTNLAALKFAPEASFSVPKIPAKALKDLLP